VRDEDLLPSFLYIPGASDFPAGSTALPWDTSPEIVVGRLAQKRGVENAGRLVSSAKSWLSHGGVDRTAPILPFRAPEGVPKYSPVEASRRYLEHLRQAWDHLKPDAPFAAQHVLVTVPASFDAVARDLTLKAAEQAGYQNITLLEEPQAAFYAWIERHPDWRERVTVGDLILVVDIGGGTTDFTLIAVTEQAGELSLERVAVGEHILLGGDNIDLALARLVADQLAQQGTKIDNFQLQALWNNCRTAKEKLLDPGNKKDEAPVTILGKGTGVVGGSIKAKLQRADLDRLLTEGFLPAVSSNDMPARQRRAGLQEIGLPYAADAAMTRHMARFLRQQASAVEQGGVRRGAGVLAIVETVGGEVGLRLHPVDAIERVVDAHAEPVPREPVRLTLAHESRPLERPPRRRVVGEHPARDDPAHARLRQQPAGEANHELGPEAEATMLGREAVADLDLAGGIDQPDGSAVTDHAAVERDEPDGRRLVRIERQPEPVERVLMWPPLGMRHPGQIARNHGRRQLERRRHEDEPRGRDLGRDERQLEGRTTWPSSSSPKPGLWAISQACPSRSRNTPAYPP